MLIVERIERQYLADRTGLASAVYAAGVDYEPPSFDDQIAALNEALEREPQPVTERERDNLFWRRELGVA